MFEAKKRFGLSVLDYVVTSNHIHLLVKVYGLAVVKSSKVQVFNVVLQRVQIVQAVQSLRSVQNVQTRNSEARKRFGLSVLSYTVTSRVVFVRSQEPPKRYAVIDVQDTSGDGESGDETLTRRSIQLWRLRAHRVFA